MKLKEQVKQMIMQYPSLFQTATQAYDQLFYVIGNGFEWKDGELVEPGFVIKTKDQCVKDCIKYGFDRLFGEDMTYEELGEERADEMKYDHYKWILKEMQEKIDIILNAEKLAEDFSIPSIRNSDFPFEFYPISKYSYCNNVPDDIKDDWKEGINKINEIRTEYEKKCGSRGSSKKTDC